MPWDAAELHVAPVGSDGRLGASLLVAGGGRESALQPLWSPDGRLHFVSDRSDWWNLYRLVDDRIEPLTDLEAEFATPPGSLERSTMRLSLPRASSALSRAMERGHSGASTPPRDGSRPSSCHSRRLPRFSAMAGRPSSSAARPPTPYPSSSSTGNLVVTPCSALRSRVTSRLPISPLPSPSSFPLPAGGWRTASFIRPGILTSSRRRVSSPRWSS